VAFGICCVRRQPSGSTETVAYCGSDDNRPRRSQSPHRLGHVAPRFSFIRLKSIIEPPFGISRQISSLLVRAFLLSAFLALTHFLSSPYILSNDTRRSTLNAVSTNNMYKYSIKPAPSMHIIYLYIHQNIIHIRRICMIIARSHPSNCIILRACNILMLGISLPG
jgi:hypothetical protein